MKTIHRVWILPAALLFSTVFFTCSQLTAQTIISIESFADSSLVMKIQNNDLSEEHQQLIFIIDNSLMTYQLSEKEVFALLDTKTPITISSDIHELNATKTKINEQDDELIKYLVEKALKEENEEEDSLVMEEWMYSSGNWLNETISYK